MWSLLAAGLALGGNAAISAGGGFDSPTEQPWVGLDLALFPGHARGVAAHGRLTGGYGFADESPLGIVELGFTGVIPNDEAIVRLGLAARFEGIYTEYGAAVALGALGAEGDPAFGLIPGGMLLLEFEWGEEAPFTVRASGGASSIAVQCGLETNDDCIGWRGGFLGGISARGRLKSGIFLEAAAGPSVSALVGYGFPVGNRRGLSTV
ncbi:MAG: hypothetical protein H0V89_01970, partial [Deltaproteobacteria bacterium]|nr:hypothetical protein [Deltaproteobacteria bacterium]